MTTPEISVIVALYKCPQYIAPLIESLFAQTLSNWECILIDDGSDMPEITEICRRYEQQDGRVRYIYQENAGFSTTVNRAAARATGDYVTIIGHDDFIAPTCLQKQVAYMRENPQIGMLSVHSTLVGKDGKPLARQPFPDIPDSPLVFPPQEKLAPAVMTGGSLCFYRERFLEIGGWDADFVTGEDNEIRMRMLDKYAIALLRERLFFYRQHDGAGRLSELPDYWKYLAAGYAAAYHRRGNTPEPAGARPFNLLSSLKHMPDDILSVVFRRARSPAKQFLRQKRYGELAETLHDFNAAFSFDRKYRRRMHRSLLAWAFFYGKFPALPVILRSIAKNP